MKGKNLFGIARHNTISRPFIKPLNTLGSGIVKCQC